MYCSRQHNLYISKRNLVWYIPKSITMTSIISSNYFLVFFFQVLLTKIYVSSSLITTYNLDFDLSILNFEFKLGQQTCTRLYYVYLASSTAPRETSTTLKKRSNFPLSSLMYRQVIIVKLNSKFVWVWQLLNPKNKNKIFP